MLVRIGDWKKLERTLSVPKLVNATNKYMSVAINRAGLTLVRAIKKKIRSISSPPNHPITIARKGSSSPLIDNGDLFNSITKIQLSPLDVFVGVPNGLTDSETGTSLALIARVLEGGEIGKPHETIILPKNAKSLFVPLKKGVRPKDPGLIRGEDFVLFKVVRIQPRPFIGPALKESEAVIFAIYEAGFRAAILSLTKGI